MNMLFDQYCQIMLGLLQNGEMRDADGRDIFRDGLNFFHHLHHLLKTDPPVSKVMTKEHSKESE